ncbi:hypothetical protein PXC01_18305 [Maribacter sp. M208]|uniref:DUF6980 family protein n=1 Tax=Maribacter huludaoensis TaxID=3030010 RepID=UPI0023EBD464|nr:hypothetical protein [Maribacter huludaoensis]MDF4223555.1 hypothetical protein [Maribacter huludaoensis]
MTLEEFKLLHYRFSKLPLPKEVWESEEYGLYTDLLHDNKDFFNWTLMDKFEKSGFESSKYCCLEMADKIYEGLDEKGKTEYGNVDIVMRKWDDGTYGIPIHDGGSSIIEIKFCPWCGNELEKASC